MRVTGMDAGAGLGHEPAHLSLAAQISMVRGEIMNDLAEHGPSSLRALNQRLPRSIRVVLMAAGALLDKGAVTAVEWQPEIILEVARAGEERLFA